MSDHVAVEHLSGGRRAGRSRGDDRRRRPGRAAAAVPRAGRVQADPRPAHPPSPRPRGGARPGAGAPSRCAGADPPARARERAAGHRHDGARPGDPERGARDRAAAHARSHGRDALAADQRHRRVHRRHAVQGLGRRRARAGSHHLRRTSRFDHGHAARTPAGNPDPPRPHRPHHGGRRARAQPVRAHLARSRPRGHRAVHGARRARHPDPARRRLRRRPQGLGALARRLGRHRARLAGCETGPL